MRVLAHLCQFFLIAKKIGDIVSKGGSVQFGLGTTQAASNTGKLPGVCCLVIIHCAGQWHKNGCSPRCCQFGNG